MIYTIRDDVEDETVLMSMDTPFMKDGEVLTVAEVYDQLNNTMFDLHKDFTEWYNLIEETSDKETQLDRLRLEILNLEFETDQTTDYKALYGAKNDKVREAHYKKTFGDKYTIKKDLERSIDHNLRRINYLKSMIAMKIQLIKYGE